MARIQFIKQIDAAQRFPTILILRFRRQALGKVSVT